MSHQKPKDTRQQLIDRAAAQARGYEERIARQKASIDRLLENPDAAAEITELNRQLSEARVQIEQLEAYISQSSTVVMELVTKDAVDEDPAVTKEGEAGPPVAWTPPVDVHRPTKVLPSL
jgi:hypothetical protein